MAYKIATLQNTFSQAIPPVQPSIVIKVSDANWAEAYANWLKGKNPTDSPEWKSGVVATFSLEQ